MSYLSTNHFIEPSQVFKETLAYLVDHLPEDLLGTVTFLSIVASAGAQEIIRFLGKVNIQQDSFMRKMDRNLVRNNLVGVQKGVENRYFLIPLGKEAAPLVAARLGQILVQHQQDFAAKLTATMEHEAKLGRWLGKNDHAHWQEVGRCIQCGRNIASSAKWSRLHSLLQQLDTLLKEVYPGEL